jgi:hypothetical protein
MDVVSMHRLVDLATLKSPLRSNIVILTLSAAEGEGPASLAQPYSLSSRPKTRFMRRSGEPPVVAAAMCPEPIEEHERTHFLSTPSTP